MKPSIGKLLGVTYWPSLARLLGPPPLLLECDPATHAAVVAGVERQVYGRAGLERGERRATPELKRLARRALAQFLCQRALGASWWTNVARSALFALALIPLTCYFLIRGLRDARKASPEGKGAGVVVFFLAERLCHSIGPDSFSSRVHLHTRPYVHLGPFELGFLARTMLACPRFALHPVLLLNALRWVSHYGYVTHHYRPRTVVHFFEGTASSSLMTAFLHEQGMRHVNIQHGEMMYTADSAFCEFDEIRVWGRYFRDIYVWHRSPAAAITVRGNPYHRRLFHTMRRAQQPRPRRMLIIDPFVYRGAAGGYPSLVRVLQRLDAGWEVRIRRHPEDVSPELAFLKALDAEPTLLRAGVRVREETPRDAPIEQALARSRVVVGVASAALIEAWIAGCKVIHLRGSPDRGTLMDRYGGSRNALYADESADLESFLATPAVLDPHEDRKVHHVTSVLEEGGGA